jgi:hypothetical protein
MFGPQNPFLFPSTQHRDAREHYAIMMRAQRMFDKAHRLGTLWSLWQKMRGCPNHLLDLAQVVKENSVTNAHYTGSEIVSIDRIIGSEGRSKDFNAGFYPAGTHNKERWSRVAAARLTNVVLPPPELIKIDWHYFVRDGHHRISVAKVLGEKHIDVVVTEWEIDGVLARELDYSPRVLSPFELQLDPCE